MCLYFRFIKLIDCDHIVEVGGMDKWVKSRDDSQIGYPRCPICNVLIKKTPRYFREIKQTFEDVQMVKKKNYGDSKIIKRSFEDFSNNIDKLDKDHKITALFAKGNH